MNSFDLYRNRVKYTIQESRINIYVSKIQNNFIDSPSYYEVNINNNQETTGVQIVDKMNNTSLTSSKVKSIIMYPGDMINVGDVVRWNSEDWLCSDNEYFLNSYYKGLINRCNQTLIWKSGNTIHSYPCIAGSKSDLLDENNYITLPDGKISVLIPYHAISDSGDIALTLIGTAGSQMSLPIQLKQRFIFNSQVYEVTWIDDLADNVNGSGNLKVSMQSTTANNLDDFVNKIADNSHLHLPLETDGDIW